MRISCVQIRTPKLTTGDDVFDSIPNSCGILLLFTERHNLDGRDAGHHLTMRLEHLALDNLSVHLIESITNNFKTRSSESYSIHRFG